MSLVDRTAVQGCELAHQLGAGAAAPAAAELGIDDADVHRAAGLVVGSGVVVSSQGGDGDAVVAADPREGGSGRGSTPLIRGRQARIGTGRGQLLGTADIGLYASDRSTVEACSVHWDGHPALAAALPSRMAFRCASSSRSTRWWARASGS
jgi:hypothetical protein